jgi:HPt (histidine-containing phosphotransfer) domain-containing protein
MVEKSNHSSEALDCSELLARVDNDHELLAELLGLFKDEAPRLLHSLEEAVSREDMRAVEMTGHALKGMLASLSGKRAALTASRLEQMGQTGEKSELRGVFVTLQAEVTALLQALDTYLEATAP